MQRPRRSREQTTPEDDDLLALGRHLARLRRQCRRLRRRKDRDWAEWSAAVEETNRVARAIGRIPPRDLSGLLVRHEAVHWLMLDADDAIMDATARKQFVAFGRALRRLARA